MLKIFCGFDPREAPGFHVFCASVIHRASIPVSFIPLHNQGMPQGTNAFTLSRFLIPHLVGYQGRAVFMDAADMICLTDVRELEVMLEALPDDIGVALVKHNYTTKHKVKYIGTPMESPNTNYERKNWASVMLINCEHIGWKVLTPSAIASRNILSTLQFEFMNDGEIVGMSREWNVLVDEGQPIEGAKILHWTAGIPAFEHYKNAPGANLWEEEWQRTTRLFATG